MVLLVLPFSLAQAQAPVPSCVCEDLMATAWAAEQEGRLNDAAALLDSALAVGTRAGDKDLVARTLVQRGTVFMKLGLPDRALSDLLLALDLREGLHDSKGLAEVNNNIGSIQQQLRNFGKARTHYARSHAIYAGLGLQREVGKMYNNFGALYEDQGMPDSALAYHRRSMAVWQQLDEPVWMGVSFMHLGECHRLLGRYDSARHYLRRASELLMDPYMAGLVRINIGELHLSEGRPALALEPCGQALRDAVAQRASNLEQRACGCLFAAHEALGDARLALAYHKRHIALRDSVAGQDMVKELTRLELAHAFTRRQLADSLANAAEQLRKDLVYQEHLGREREQRNIFLFSGVGVLMLAGGLWSRARNLRRSRAEVQRERERSDQLLLNILPQEVAEELKDTGTAQARHFEQATILFTDFKGFTAMSEQVAPTELVSDLNECFSAFDRIAEQHGIEKIKTIGDAYMAVGGVPTPNTTHAADVVHAALAMRDHVEATKARKIAAGLPFFEIRIGVHTGPVVAGIVGLKKFQYDIWGDTVNTASRMESSGEPGRVNISAATHALVKGDPGLTFIPRGTVEAKGKGELAMWFVERA